ncbi:hypothetical protein CONLIGDRAFT_697241 [Coniochaeta ligniaria NRRL 30616]|uniref:Myb-like domain-containing protein n=1 Tax=Coniochaeta ligniaria NRRL 30616 TaxID=1408157 RepID=A0A1J7J0B4_9PEZI|nr:hypothetical protein CONLIGDRAFT_697241 [Coniochaeta ligniaria NRRL 30616]
MSSSFVIPAKLRRVPIQVYDHDSHGPRHSDIPVLQLRLLVCQTTKLRTVADAVARFSSRGNQIEWKVGKILDRYGDEFVDPAETVWGALELVPICIMKAPPEREEQKLPRGHEWNAQEDQTLFVNRAAGHEWKQIQANHFPTMTINACQKRYYRLMKRNAADDRPSTSGVEPSPEVMPALQAQSETLQTRDQTGEPDPVVSSSPVYFDSSPTTKIAVARAPLIWSSSAENKQTVNLEDIVRTPASAAQHVALSQGASTAQTDDSEDEPLIIPVPKATDSYHTARNATTQSVFNRKALYQHHRRKLRRESVTDTPSPGSSQGSAEQPKVDQQSQQQRLQPTDPIARLEYESKSSLEELTIRRPNQGRVSFAPDGSETQVVEPNTSRNGVSPSLLYDKEIVQPTKRKAMSLTLIRVRGKRKPKQESSENVDAERELSRQQEEEYDALIDANLRRAKDEAERQTSASKIERAERFIRSSFSPRQPSSSQRSSSPFEIDSSPTVRVANNRHIQAQFLTSQLPLAGTRFPSGLMDSYQNDSETPSSPPVLGESDTSYRGVPFAQDEQVTEDQLDAGIYGAHGWQSMPAQRSTSGNAEDCHPKQHAEQSTSHSDNTGASQSQVAEGPSRPMWVPGEKRKRHAGPPTVSENNDCLNRTAREKHQLHRSNDRVSKTHGAKTSPTTESTARKPGF